MQTNTEIKKRYYAVDVSRVYGAFLVLSYHSYEIYYMFYREHIVHAPIHSLMGELLFYSRVPFFLLLSGYFIAKNLEKPLFNAKLYYLKIWKTLVIPYLVWNTISYLLRFFGEIFGQSFEQLEKFDALTAISRISGLGLPPSNGPLWFIRDIISISIVAPCLWKFRNLILLPCLVLIMQPNPSTELWNLGLPRFSSLGFFGIGMLIYLIPKEILVKIFPNPILSLLLCLGFGLLWIIADLDQSLGLPQLIGAIGIFMVGVSINNYFPNIAHSISFHGSGTFLLFASHYPLIVILHRIHVMIGTPLNPIVFYSLLPFVVGFTILYINYILKRKSSWTLIWLSGGR